MRSGRFVGIDVGAERLHVATIDASGKIRGGAVFPATDLAHLAAWLGRAEVVAIDAPATLSTAPHVADETLPPKFRLARCAEIGLGRLRRCWVPWATPTGPPLPGWMETGLAVYEALTRSGRVLLEVYPYAGFRQLAGGPLPRKTTAAGRTQRVTLLRSAGVRRGHLKLWSHDSIDALLGALVARQYADGKALKATCGHDDSAIWLP